MNTFNVEWMHLDLGFAVTPSAELFPFNVITTVATIAVMRTITITILFFIIIIIIIILIITIIMRLF